MSDRYDLYCEAHDSNGVGLKSSTEALGFIWANRAALITLLDAFNVVDSPYQVEVEWRNAFGSDHEFDVPLLDVAAWMKQHNDCPVYVYSYGARVGTCYDYVACQCCGTKQRCKRQRDHDGDHSTVRDDDA